MSVFLPLEVAGTVSVSVGDEVEAQEAGVVGLGGSHEIHATHIHHLAILNVLGVVLQRQKNSTAAPAELVSWIWSVRSRRCASIVVFTERVVRV